MVGSSTGGVAGWLPSAGVAGSLPDPEGWSVAGGIAGGPLVSAGAAPLSAGGIAGLLAAGSLAGVSFGIGAGLLESCIEFSLSCELVVDWAAGATAAAPG